MADEAKIGTDWSDDDVDAIVADYFAMLAEEQARRPYVKSHRAAALMEQIGRTHRSVEFKHMNISAVLEALGLPTIRGYKPKPNVQKAIFPAIERYLTANPAVLAPPLPVTVGLSDIGSVFEEAAPAITPASNPRSERLEALVRKFDPVERDFRNRALGQAGEAVIVDLERRRLVRADRPDLARKVRWVSQEDGDGAGYDILSFNPAGEARLIEVKTTYGGRVTPFFLTRNEKAVADERPDAYRIFRLYDFSDEPRLFRLRPPLENAVILTTETYRASFG